MTNNTKSLEGRIKRWLATSPHPNGPLWFEQLTTDLITENARLLAEVESLKTKYYCKHCARSWNYYTDELPNFHAYGDKPCPGPVILLGKSNKGE